MHTKTTKWYNCEPCCTTPEANTRTVKSLLRGPSRFVYSALHKSEHYKYECGGNGSQKSRLGVAK